MCAENYSMKDAVLVINGRTITSAAVCTPVFAANDIPTRQTYTKPKSKINGNPEYGYRVSCNDEEDHADYLYLKNLARLGAEVVVSHYPRGNVAGRLIISGNAVVSEAFLDGAPDKNTTFDFDISYTGRPTETPNIVLANETLTAVGQGDAYSGVNIVPSGGTAPYTVTFPEGAIVVQGITISSSGVVGGTADVDAPIALHRQAVRVTDSAATPVVKDFIVVIPVVA